MAGVLKTPRKDFVRWLEVVISIPSGMGIDELAFFNETVAWAEEFRDFEVPILSAIIHNDEEKPHVHLLMLPLFQGRMIGSSIAKPNKYWVRHEDFNAKVGRRYGLSLPVAKTYHSAVARAAATDSVIMAMKSAIKNLEPAFWDAIRAQLKLDPFPMMQYYGIEYPAKPCKPEKTKALQIENPKLERIGKPKALHVQPVKGKTEALPVYGFAESLSQVSPDDTSQSSNQDDYVREREEDPPACDPMTNDAEYTRERDEDYSAGSYDYDTGEHIQPPTKVKPKSVKFEQARITLATIAARKRSNEART